MKSRPKKVRSFKALAVSAAAASTVFAAASPARAQGSYRSLPLGGRSALLGNTGVAFAEDNAAAFLNPATLASTPGTRVAVSVNFFRFATLNLGSWYAPGAVDPNRYPGLTLPEESLSRAGFTALPSSLCVSTVFGKEPDPKATGEISRFDHRPRVAFCYATREQSRVDFSALARTVTAGPYTDDRIQTLATALNRFDIGPTISAAVDEHWSFGASFLATVTSLDQTLATSAVTYDATKRGVVTGVEVFRDSNSTDFSLLVGARWKPTREMTFGLSISTPTIHLLGSYAGTTESRILFSGSARDSIAYDKGSFVSSTPLRISIGAGFIRKRTRIEVDAFFAAPNDAQARAKGDSVTTSYDNGNISNATGTFERALAANAVVNAAVGIEHFIKPGLSILGGVSTDFSPVALGSSRPTLDQIMFSKRSRAAVSIGVGSYGQGGDILVGADIGYQWGIAAAPNPYSATPGLDWIDTNGIQVMLVLSGSTSITTLKRAMNQVTNLVTGAPVVAPSATPKVEVDPNKPATAPPR